MFSRGKRILNDRVGWLDGLVVATSDVTLAIDPTRLHRLPSNAIALVSHAHADHTRGFGHRGHKQSTSQTRDIHRILNNQKVSNFSPLEIGNHAKFDDTEVDALDAGHMLGSAQFLVRTPQTTILYTGDINCVDTLTTQAAEPEKCDVLVIEATYGSPFYKFPPREITYANIVEWALDTIKRGVVPCLHVYAAGKGQEIVRLFNTYTRIPVVVDHRLDGVNETYLRNGQHLRWLTDHSKEGKETLEKMPCIYVTTPNDRKHLGRRFSRAYATGWALISRDRTSAFPLSSHADFDQLVDFIKQCQPTHVYIFTGFAEELRRSLKARLGIDAREVPSLTQRTLWETY